LIISSFLHIITSEEGEELLDALRGQSGLPLHHLQAETDYGVHIFEYLPAPGWLNALEGEALA
jgi:hypothetical protein